MEIAVRWRGRAKVDGHVKYLSRGHANELALWAFFLKVQAPEDAPDRTGLALLHEPRGEPGVGKVPVRPCLEEISPGIPENPRVDFPQALYR